MLCCLCDTGGSNYLPDCQFQQHKKQCNKDTRRVLVVVSPEYELYIEEERIKITVLNLVNVRHIFIFDNRIRIFPPIFMLL